MKESKIHFQNEPFMARVAGEGEDSIRCTPAVYDDWSRCGVGIFFGNGRGQVWGLVMPRNLIAAWRGTEVLRRLDTIKHGTLCAAYYTGVRDPHKSDMKRHVQPTIAKIGRAAYDAIMVMPVPEQIIRAILDNQKGDFAPALCPITDEVRAGTIQWREEFVTAGVTHPAEIDAKKRAQDETVAKFERLLVSYAGSRHLSRECRGMSHVEGALLTLVDKGADRTHPDHVLVALAGVVGELALSEFAMSMLPFGPRNQEGYDARLQSTKERAIDRAGSWLASNSGRWGLALWRGRQGSFTPVGAQQLLRRLLEEYFPLKLEVPHA